ncbi:permease [Salmonella enterica subsp. enterica]|nr:permease [Salmonella enterica subsp. enterica serovar Javiana]EEK7952498.1 permease [Salmonella enterica subsp. enterica serovar Javiana]EEK7979336.1 permease [Salmonella enterica subsp. enterica serovar Javiana]EEK8040083.1 permease [Salmonella enterica subsp. enterica serovar Javiana]EEK8073039.1 permease [Salmonella enterica subsp. enterica serovar Javiana]
MNNGFTMLTDTAKMFLFLAAELSLLFLAISLVVNSIRQKIPDSKIQMMLGARKGRGYVIAALLGAITPFCSCSTIPMLRGLLSARAGFGPTLTFLFVSPLLNPIIVGLMWATFGLKITLLYIFIAALVSVMASVTLSKFGFERYVINTKEANGKLCSTSCSTTKTKGQVATCCSITPKPSALTYCGAQSVKTDSSCCASGRSEVSAKRRTITLAWQEAWKQFREVFPYLLAGVLIGSLIYGFVPTEWIVKHAGGDSEFAIPLSAIVGIPLYIRAEAVIPLASALVAKGMGTGAVMALIIGSAGASLTEVILLKSMFRTPMIIAFLIVILGMAVMMGYLTQLLF